MLRSRTKTRLNAVVSAWSTPFVRMDGSSSNERPKRDHIAALTGQGAPDWADRFQLNRARGVKGGPARPLIRVTVPLPPPEG